MQQKQLDEETRKFLGMIAENMGQAVDLIEEGKIVLSLRDSLATTILACQLLGKHYGFNMAEGVSEVSMRYYDDLFRQEEAAKK